MAAHSLPPAPNHCDDDHARQAHWQRRIQGAWWVFAGIALFYLLSEHRAHLFGVLPYLLLLACPLMHLFMHHGHGHGHRDKTSGKEEGRAGGANDEPR